MQAQEQREVLVEIFTNSHCPLCPNAHNTLDVYLNTSPNANKINYIYYHMVYPYSDDLLYIQSSIDSDERHTFYNPLAATPRGFFDGVIQGSFTGWANTLDKLTQTQSPLKIELTGTKSVSQFNINAAVTRTGNISDTDLVINFVVVEDVYYDGRNTISHHKQVMRKMLPTANGLSLLININETTNIQQSIDINPIWDADSLNVIVFIQSISTKNVYQSETINNSDLSLTNLENEEISPSEYLLHQNYPNPFNSITKINYQLPEVISTAGKSLFVVLKVYDVLGNEVSTLVNEEKPVGKYEVEFAAEGLFSGIYFYTLIAGNVWLTKKMILLK